MALPLSNAQGSRINDHGAVAGEDFTTHHAFRYANGVVTDAGTLGSNSYALGINSSGQLLGYSFVSTLGGYRNFLAQDGSVIGLGFDLGGGAINDAGHLAGSQLYSGGVLLPIAESGDVLAYAINDSGVVSGGINGEAFIFEKGVLRRLGTLGSRNAFGYDINNAGIVVGGSELASGTLRHGFVYANGTMTDLNAIAAVPAGLTIVYASAVNDSGYIIGQLSDGVRNPDGTLAVLRPALLVPNATAAPKIGPARKPLNCVGFECHVLCCRARRPSALVPLADLDERREHMDVPDGQRRLQRVRDTRVDDRWRHRGVEWDPASRACDE